LSDFPDWKTSNAKLTNLTTDQKGLIEIDAPNHSQMDFANKCIGGGVLGRGSIQEEIRFAISTELIVSLLFTAVMEDNEVVVIKGAQRFSNYHGYAASFQFKGNFNDNSPVDEENRKKVTVVAMDAIFFGSKTIEQLEQYQMKNIRRELYKAFCALSKEENQTLPVATGNWGTGGFHGFQDLKCILQLIAASQANVEIRYFYFWRKRIGSFN